MAFLSGFTNVTLISQCSNLEDLTVTFTVTDDLVTVGDTGFGLQLNCFPQANQVFQNQTLNWFQYGMVIGSAAGYEPNNDQNIGWFVEYWDTNAQNLPWPPGYTPNPPNTNPGRPVIPNDTTFTTFGPAPNNRILTGSILQIVLTTANGNVTKATFNYTDPSNTLHTDSYTFASNAAFPIYGAQLVLVGPFNAMPISFTSGAGSFTYAISSGTLAVESAGSSCSGVGEPGTAEESNSIYGPITPASGASVTQSVDVIPMTMSFNFEQSTFGQDEVELTPFWNPAYYLAITGFPNNALGLNQPSDLNSATLSPQPTIGVAIDASQNLGLAPSQIATIGANLPVMNTFTPPILATDGTLTTNYQTFLYPYSITFPNLKAFNALTADQTAVLTLSAKLGVPVPTGGNTNSGVIQTTNVPVSCGAEIVLAKGEDPRMEDLNPAAPLSYPSWLSYDLRIFTVTAGQTHKMFSVATPSDASGAVSYIQQVLKHLNKPSLITNGDTFDNALTQSEDASEVPWLPNLPGQPVQLAFAVARVRIKSSITETIGPVRVFFRLFAAASTATTFEEVGTGEGLYRWGTDGTAGHKIPLLGVQGAPGSLEYVTIPCFATERINLSGPADMNTQHDKPNAVSITTAKGAEVDTFFGCWLDVNQTSTFLIPTPPNNPAQWDGPWTGTESLNGAIAVAPHQCLVAEIRFDDTPIPNGVNTADSDKLAQRNIAWLGVQP
ncbi:MAG: hypothetical protein WCF69_01420 [Mycobacterium sp.]